MGGNEAMLRQIQMMLAICLLSSAVYAAEDGPLKRDVKLTYSCLIERIPEGAISVDLWLPVASDTDG